MKRYIEVKGGNKLEGELLIEGAKNSALFLVCAALLTKEKVVLKNVPDILDIEILNQIIKEIGCESLWDSKNGCMEIISRKITNDVINERLARKLRASICLLCPLILRRNKVIIPFPGGDKIGSRPIDELLRGLKLMGATVNEGNGTYVITKNKDLVPIKVELTFPSHTATIGLMILAAGIDGKTIIENAAKEPEMIDMQILLNRMGAKVIGAGTETITIEGKRELSGAEMEVIPDRLQIGTYMIASLLTEGTLTMPLKYLNHLKSLLELLKNAGAKIKYLENNKVVVSGRKPYKSVSFETNPYPGFPTDLQSPMMSFLAHCKGKSYVKENLYENRFLHVPEMRKLGAIITTIDERTVLIEEMFENISESDVFPEEIRGAAALLIMALAAPIGSVTRINNIEHLERGYPNIVSKINNLGGKLNVNCYENVAL